MRIRYNPKAKEEILACKKYLEGKEALQTILKQHKEKKIYLEIGMGKGDFISHMAKADPNNLYIGVEVCLPVLALATKKVKRYEEEEKITLDNLFFMSFDAIELSEYFEENQVEKLYLNFSDPWPKKKHAKRRLTYATFLEQYKKVLKQGAMIEFKTDNRILFEFSLVSMQNFGMTFLEVYLDLHQTDIPNVVTEYEEKFSKNGPIYKLVAKMN